MSFVNVYEDPRRAAAYAQLAYPGTYHLAFRDLPELLGRPGPWARALDFGCGAGRSSRFLQGLGYRVEGADISEAMLTQARAQDPQGLYLRVPEGDLSLLAGERYDRILSAFTFDNITPATKAATLKHLARLLKPGGRLLNLVSSEELYRLEWASFSTAGFPGNREPRAGDAVFTIMKDVPDSRPVEDVFCPEAEYRRLYRNAGLSLLGAHRPLGREDEPFPWINETRVAPWRIDILERPVPPVPAGSVFGVRYGAI